MYYPEVPNREFVNLRKFSTCLGASPGNSSKVIFPELVSRRISASNSANTDGVYETSITHKIRLGMIAFIIMRHFWFYKNQIKY